MNATRTPSPPHAGIHPSPQRDRVGAWAIWFGILGAPVAWSVQQLVNPTILAHGCFPHDVPLTDSIWANARTVTTLVELVCIAVCVAAGAVAWRSWQRTREEKPGSGHHLIEAGEGRSRFMAMVGLICSGLFLAAVLFATAVLYMVAPCNG